MTHSADRGSHEQRPRALTFRDCILVPAGAGFIFGGTGGSVFHFLKALRSSPSGSRLAGGAQAVRANAPRVAATWAGLSVALSAVEAAMYFARRKEDPWNGIVAFACMSGLHNSRNGLKSAVGSALVGAVFMGLVEIDQIREDANIADPAACSDGDPTSDAQ